MSKNVRIKLNSDEMEQFWEFVGELRLGSALPGQVYSVTPEEVAKQCMFTGMNFYLQEAQRMREAALNAAADHTPADESGAFAPKTSPESGEISNGTTQSGDSGNDMQEIRNSEVIDPDVLARSEDAGTQDGSDS